MIRRALITILAACGGGGEPTKAMPDAPGNPVDAREARLPTWMLEDVEPTSPRFGQTYGLDVFTDHTVVVTLVEGF